VREEAFGTTKSLESRLIVAGGGGGGGGGVDGRGGNASGTTGEAGACGEANCPGPAGGGGGGGTSTEGGAGGSAGSLGGHVGAKGVEGALGQGGMGGAEVCFEPTPGEEECGVAGGGGGGGYHGGGGGGSGSPFNEEEGGGGGAGSSFVSPTNGTSPSYAVGKNASGEFEPEEVVITYTPVLHATATSVECVPQTVVAGGSTTCTATVTDKATSGATTPTGNVPFTTSGSGSFNEASCTLAGSGATASCEVTYTPTATTAKPERSDEITAKYEGDETHEATEGATTVTVFSPTALARGAFVIGNDNAAVGGSVTFYEAEQWSRLNSLSGGSAPASFKGFAESSASPPTCGEQWTSKPGTSSAPPATVPEYMELVVASKITKSGSTISGNATEVVVVKTNPGYGPETKGTGKVVAVVCKS
jgi:hypothetical protein